MQLPTSIVSNPISLPPSILSSQFSLCKKDSSFSFDGIPTTKLPLSNSESSSNSWPPLTSIDAFLSPQNYNISITNPTFPPLIHDQNDVVEVPQYQMELIQQLMSENLNPNSDIAEQFQEVSNEIIRGEKEILPREKEIWYKGPWTKCEDRQLRRLVSRFGRNAWATVAQYMSRRIGKQCRERWVNNLCPPIQKNIVWSDEEEMIIIEGQKRFGNRWSKIARFLPGRSENDVKNHWNKTLRRQFSTRNIQRSKRLRGLYQSTVLETYIRKKLFSAAAAGGGGGNAPPIAADVPPPITTIVESNPLFEVVSAATASSPPPIPTMSENSALISTSFTPPPIATATHNCSALTAADPPISVDDYEIDDGVPCFAFETAMDEISELALRSFTSETGINEISELMQSMYHDVTGDAEGPIGSPIVGDADCAASEAYFAAETVGEEMEFMRSLFGNNGGI